MDQSITMSALERMITMRIIEHFEASDHCKLDSYIVPGEEHLQATNGWGRAIPLSSHPMRIDKTTADRWLTEDIDKRFNLLKLHVPVGVILRMTPGQVAAFISWAYNGKGWINSDSFKALQAGNLQAFINGASLWYHGEHGVVLPGLVRRRAVERHLWERGEFERITTKLNFYHDLPDAVNVGLKHGMHHGRLVWKTDRLFWNPAA